MTFGLSSGHLPVSPVATADSGRMVSLYADGQKRLFSTDAATVSEVLKRAALKLNRGDLVEPDLDMPLSKGQFNINVYRAHPVLVMDGVTAHRITSAYQSPRLLALAAGLKVFPEDEYKTEVITNIVGDNAIGDKVTLVRAKPLAVQVDGTTRHLRTQEETLGGALKHAGIALGLKDTVSAPLTSQVLPGETVAVTRVSEAVVTLTEAIPHQTQTITDPSILKGQTQIKTKGADGSTTTTFLIHYTNGVETGRQALKLVNQVAPVTQVVVLGTKVMFPGNIEYWRPQVVAAATQWGLDPNMMLRIMQCESNGNATDVSAFVINGQHPTGLFQYLPSTWISAGGTADNIFDGALQIQLTAKKMATQGTAAWQCK
jgi:resuscitation-promoting factor RpfB